MSPTPDETRPLEYASPGKVARYGWYTGRIVALAGLIVLTLILLYLVALEFVPENGAGSGSLLDPGSQITVAFIIAFLGIIWLTLLVHLLEHKFCFRGWQ